MIPLVYRQVNMGCDYDAVRENDMIEARMLLHQMSLNELEKLADRHAKGAAFDNYPIRWSGLMERRSLCEEIVRAEANILAAVLLEWGLKGSSGRGTGEVIGTAPSAQAGGAVSLPDFSLEFAGFFPREISCPTRENYCR